MASSDLYLTTESEITSIANAIRSKGGTLDFLTYPTGFVTAIEEIQTGGTLQSKSVTPSESSITVVPDIGYDGLSQVLVDAISSNYIGSGVARKSAADVTVSGPTITAPAGYYSAQVVKTVSAGAASVPATTINVTPSISVSATGLISVNVSSSSNISPSITSGYISSGTSGQVTASGSSSLQLITLPSRNYIPTTVDQTIDDGFFLAGAQTIAGDSNLIAENIKNGTTIFGVNGTFGPDDIIVIGDYGLCLNNFTVSGNICTSAAGTVSGNTLIAV